MKLRSTTWKGRNEVRLKELKTVFYNSSLTSPIIADVGIGGVTSCLADLFPEGHKKSMNFMSSTQRFFVRLADNFARKHGYYKQLKNYELGEVLNFFSEFNPTQILVVDNDERILNQVEESELVKKLNIDICKTSLPKKVDLLICYNVLQICDSPKMGLRNILNSVSLGGLISLETGGLQIDVNKTEFELLGDSIYKRIA